MKNKNVSLSKQPINFEICSHCSRYCAFYEQVQENKDITTLFRAKEDSFDIPVNKCHLIFYHKPYSKTWGIHSSNKRYESSTWNGTLLESIDLLEYSDFKSNCPLYMEHFMSSSENEMPDDKTEMDVKNA